MAGGYSAIRWLQVGEQSGTTDTPGAFTFLDPQGDINPTAVQGKVDIQTERDDGEITAPVLGAKSGGFTLTSLVRGKGSGAGAGVADPGELGVMLNALFGGTQSLGTGLTSGASHDTDTIKMATTAGFPVGNGLLINSLSGGIRNEAREVISVVTDTSVDLDRALQGTPDDSEVAYASASYYIDADNSAHTHLYYKMEGENWRRDFLGCALKLVMNFPAGGLANFTWEIMANTYSDEAEENPTYSSPTSAPALSVLGSPFWWGSDKTELIDGSLDFAIEPQPRQATEGSEGNNGFIYSYGGAKLTGRCYHSDTLLANMQSATTYDVAFQLGDTSSNTTRGNCVYIRIPALAVTDATIETFNGVDVINFTGTATRPSAGNGSVRLHLFASAA